MSPRPLPLRTHVHWFCVADVDPALQNQPALQRLGQQSGARMCTEFPCSARSRARPRAGGRSLGSRRTVVTGTENCNGGMIIIHKATKHDRRPRTCIAQCRCC